MKSSELWARRERSVPRGVGNATRIFVERARGAEIWDCEGRRFLDFVGGIAVLNVGHCHPAVVAAVKAQSEKYIHPAFQVHPYEPYITLAEKLCEIAPISGDKKAIFLSTGAEAVENAVKIARAHTRRRGVIAFTGGFHGRTLLTLAMTGKVAPYKAGFGPYPGDVYHLPYPMEYRGITLCHTLDAMDHLFKSDLAPEEVAAVVIEPVLGEGYYQAPPAFLEELRKRCDAHGIVLVSDEIQAGFGRTGKWFGIEHSGVQPDLITVAKSLAGGMPLSGVVGRAGIMDAPGPGGLGGTYGGNPVACAAALAAISVIEDEGLLERAQHIGERFQRWGEETRDTLTCVGEVRGPGAMIGIELVSDRDARTPAPHLVAPTRKYAEEAGLLLLGCGYYSNVLRVMVPLVVDDAQLDEGLAILTRSLSKAQQRGATE